MNDDGQSGIKEEMKCKREEESEVLRGVRGGGRERESKSCIL